MTKTLQSTEVCFLNPKQVRIERGDFGDLMLTAGGTTHREVRAARLFPLNRKDRYVEFREREGELIGILRRMDRLAPESRGVLSEQLDKIYFIPSVVRINDVREEYFVMHFDVETDRGPREFEVKGKENFRSLPGQRMMITDADTNRFMVHYKRLDSRSRTLIEKYI